MGEQDNAGDEDVIVDEAEKGGDNQDESQKDAGAEDEVVETDKSDDEKGEKPDEADKGSEKKPESKPTPQADEEPKTRKRNIDFILERKNEKIKKLEEKANGADEIDLDNEDNLDPNDAKIIQKQVAKVLKPFISKQMIDEDTQEIDNFVKANADFAPYADKVKRYAQHASRKDMPIASIFYEVAGNDLLKLGADRAKKADLEAKHSKAGGGSNKGGGDGAKSTWDLTPEEFEAQKEAVRNQPRE